MQSNQRNVIKNLEIDLYNMEITFMKNVATLHYVLVANT